MLGWWRSWQGGCAVSAACGALGALRVALGHLDVLTWLLLALAVAYAVASWLDRGQHLTAPGIRRRGRRAPRSGAVPDPAPWTREPNRLAAWLAAERGYARHPGERAAAPGRPPHVVKDRVGAALVTVAAVIGFALVLHDHQREGAGADGGQRGSLTTETKKSSI